MSDINPSTRTGSKPSPHSGSGVEPAVNLPLILWRRRGIVAACVAVCLVIGVAYSFVAKPTYTGVTKLFVTKVEPIDPEAPPRPKILEPGATNYLYAQAGLLVSDTVLEDVLNRAGFDAALGLKPGRDPVEQLRRRLEVEVDETDRTLTLSARNHNAEFSAHLANAVADAYIQYHSIKKRTSSEQALGMLERQREQNASDLEVKREALAAFQRETGLLAFEAQDNEVVMKRLENLSQALTEAQLNALEAKADYDADLAIVQGTGETTEKLKRLIESQRSRGIPSPLDTTGAAERNELRLLGIRLANLREQFTDEAPAIKSLRLRIEELKAQLEDDQAQRMGRLIAAVEKNWQSARAKHTEVRHSLQAHKDAVEKARASSERYHQLRAELDEAERLAEIYDKEIRSLSIAAGTGALQIEVTNPALPPEKPTHNPIKRALALTLALGLGLGGLLALWKDFKEPRLWSPKELAAALGTPLLGVAPHMGGGLDDHQRANRSLQKPGSRAAEAFRAIRTALFYRDPKSGPGAKTVLVTSPCSGQGKTTLVANLAVTMAQAGCRTLILDTNLRRPTLHDRLDVGQGPGLAKLLTGAVEIDAAVRPTAVSNLHVLPAGRTPSNPSEILNSRAFADRLAELSERYDYIVMDSPGTLRVTDARILATLADVTVLALESNPLRFEAEEAADGLRSVGAGPVGLVVTNLERDEKRWGVQALDHPPDSSAQRTRRAA
ncbi:MAG: GumC family protein [Planctomycetota bacterium]|jgi:capsular exopolysaccharide synthesis family protein